MPHAIDLGPHHETVEVAGPRTYEITTGNRYLTGLEDGHIQRWPQRHVFMINEETGHVFIDSGYGTFAACWPDRYRGGRSIHAFLLSLKFESFMAKAHVGEWQEADIPATIAEMRADVLNDRREGVIDAKAARDLWDALADLDGGMGEQVFVHAVCEDSDLYERFCDGSIYVKKVPLRSLEQFWDEVWSAFRETILAPAVEAEGREDRAAA